MADYTSSHAGASIDAAVVKAAKLPTIAGGDANKLLRVKSDESGYETVAVLDEDDFASDSEILPPSQQSAKAFLANAGVNTNITSMTGLDDDGIPVAKVADALSASSNGIVKGWVHFNGAAVTVGNDMTGVNDSYNVSGVVTHGTGEYSIYWDTDFGNVYYAVFITVGPWDSAMVTITSQAVGSVRIRVANNAGTVQDPTIVSVMAIGHQ